MLQDLTLCSVSFHSARYLRAARSLLGDEADQVRWIVAQNGPPEQLDGFDVIAGASRTELRYPAGDSQVSLASYHHAAGLHLALKHVRTRYALLLDPDFFLAVPLADVVSHALDRELAFFGAPYAIDDNKARYHDFPCAFCMLIDGDQVPLISMDFAPDAGRNDRMADVGYDVYDKYRHLPAEAVLPSSQDYTKAPHTTDTVRSVYKNQDLDGWKYDQYFWGDHLFGLHCHMKLHLGERAKTVDGEAQLSYDATIHAHRQLKLVTRVIQAVRERPIT